MRKKIALAVALPFATTLAFATPAQAAPSPAGVIGSTAGAASSVIGATGGAAGGVVGPAGAAVVGAVGSASVPQTGAFKSVNNGVRTAGSVANTTVTETNKTIREVSKNL